MLFLDEQQIYVMQYLKVVKESYICICIYDNEITDEVIHQSHQDYHILN
jgi:hypothetical protein